jgi:uncharacterized protein YcaQ
VTFTTLVGNFRKIYCVQRRNITRVHNTPEELLPRVHNTPEELSGLAEKLLLYRDKKASFLCVRHYSLDPNITI